MKNGTMIVVDYSDRRSLVILHNSKNNNSRNENTTDGENVRESDISFEQRSSESAFRNRKSIVSNDSSNILLLANDRIGVAKHDSELYHWKVTTDKGNNTGTYFYFILNLIRLERQMLKYVLIKNSHKIEKIINSLRCLPS